MISTDRRRFMGGLLTGGAVTALSGTRALAKVGTLPNFVVIYVDDLGFGDVEPTGGHVIRTPNLNRMARGGTTLTDYYAPANLCTPSRAGLLTGRYPIRSGLAKGVILQNDTRHLKPTEMTLPRALGPAYASALIGKWHLGNIGTPAWPPTSSGFDLFYGIPYSHDMSPLSLWEADKSGASERQFTQATLQQQFADRALRFIDDNRSRPFSLTLTLSAPHLPNYPPADFAGKSAAGPYGDCVEHVDAIVGQVLGKLEALGLSRQTLVMFTSDNGPWFEGSSGGLRERKGGGGYDGASRVPFIAMQPGTVSENVRSASIAMGIDILPTLCARAGIPLPKGIEFDGRDISGVLMRGEASPHDHLVLFNDDQVAAIRTQDWKYVDGSYYKSFYMPLASRGYPQLYDMRSGGEDYSLAERNPHILAKMQALFDAEKQRFKTS